MSLTHTSVLKQALQFGYDYFIKSEDRFKAWALLLGALLAIVALVGMSFLMTWWSVGFWTAILTKDVSLFLWNTVIFTGILAGYTGISVLKNYLVDTLGLRWRQWLTQSFIDDYLKKHHYLKLARTHTQIDSPAQRIQEDVESFVTTSLSLFLESFNSILTFAIFAGTLWVLSGTLSIALFGLSFTIPGYLFWCAILFSVVGNVITHRIGRWLAENANEQKKIEAKLRKNLDFVQNESENIAQQKGEKYHQQTLMSHVKEMVTQTYQKILIRMRLVAFESFYLQATLMFPTFVMAPLLFKDKISFGQFTQAGSAFVQVQLSLSWFMGAYESFANYLTSTKRLLELKNAMQTEETSTIQIKENRLSSEIKIEHLDILKPNSTQVIMKHLNLHFNQGENTLIKGDSGLGKSTLFKVLGGTWPYGKGEVHVPDEKEMFLLSQKPLLPEDTLRAVLAYPELTSAYKTEQYQEALRLVGGLDHLLLQLDQSSPWSRRLSGGEQQRVAFARAILKKPKWLLLDEISASLDIQSERKLYRLLKEHLKETTFISIAHRPTVTEFHDRIISFEKDPQGRMKIKEERFFNPGLASNEVDMTVDPTQLSMN